MLTVLKAAIARGRVTTDYPARPDAPPPTLRGAPTIDPSRCDCSAACLSACPSAAITLTPEGDQGRVWQLDLARCVFCAECVSACPTGALAMTDDFELATRSRADLLTIVHHGPPTARPAGGEARSSSQVSLTGGTAVAMPDLGQQLTARIRRLLRRSLHIRHMDAGSDNSTDWELTALLNPIYDAQRLGIDVVASPRHADLLFVTGPVTRNLEVALKLTYEAMPSPVLVVAAGAEACGGVWQGSYAHAGGVDRVLPVDVYIPGDPPRPQAIIFGLLLALDRAEQRRFRVETPR